MRLIRSNDDPKLVADLERLAGVEVTPVPPRDVIEQDVARLATSSVGSAPDVPIDDPFVRRFVQGSVHLRKYAPFYAGVGLWLGAMLLIQPVGGGNEGTSTEAAAGSRRAVVAPVAATSEPAELAGDVDTAGSPTFDSFGGSTFDSADTAEFADFGDPEPSPAASSELAFDDSSASFESDEFESFEDEEEVPDPLAIVESGYASSSGGTPLEQAPPGGGLPITTAAGNTTKYSFVRLSGDETILRLAEAPDGNVNNATATLRMCPLKTPTWTGGPGKSMSAAPGYDMDFCAGGARSGGVWTFDLSDFAPVEGSNGFAIVPGTGTASTFQVVLKPSAVAPEEQGDA